MSKAILVYADNQLISEYSFRVKLQFIVICIFKGMNIQSFI